MNDLGPQYSCFAIQIHDKRPYIRMVIQAVEPCACALCMQNNVTSG